MNDIWEQILNKLYINKKLNHYCLNYNWFIKNDLIDLYNKICNVTYFLNDINPSLRHRLYYIENNLLILQLCPYCNINHVKFNPNKLKLNIHCGNLKCKSKHQSIIAYNQHKNMPDNIKLNRILKIRKANSKTFIEKYGIIKSNKIIEKMRIGHIGKKASESTKLKMSNSQKGRIVSPEIRFKISESNKKTHLSKEFKEKYKEVYENARIKQSISIKKTIANGDFIPCITNSWTRWKIGIDDGAGNIKKFRSSWEAAFWILNKDLKYEKLIIPYNYEGESKNYIVDFIDSENKIIYEIKPNSCKSNIKNHLKECAAINWANNNGYIYKSINDDWFIKNSKKIDVIKYPCLEAPLRKFIK